MGRSNPFYDSAVIKAQLTLDQEKLGFKLLHHSFAYTQPYRKPGSLTFVLSGHSILFQSKRTVRPIRGIGADGPKTYPLSDYQCRMAC
jgi:hypothetical protein